MFVLAKRRSEQLFTVPWRAKGTVAFGADRNVGTLVCPASPRPTVRCALRRPDPPVVCPGFGLDRSSNAKPCCCTCKSKMYPDETHVCSRDHLAEHCSEERAAKTFVFSSDETTCLVQDPDIPQVGRVGVHSGVARWARAGWYANRIGH